MSDPVIWEITMPGMPTKQFIPLAFYKQLEADYARLQADVERLRKAGDDLAVGMLKYIEPTDGYLTYLECRANWNAAKEGKQS